ncbi:LacI family DNA-binding transcriptional regulator [Actinotalea sp. K2]|uniref:LacI family DNA-binding transcriptional regulator n=1 Tax=Actinotalea sp. K2 TaxID=2939438 RepID=UPI002017A1EB|nr:LacI family DNA-binding transcriptional regulator [Actinotalea sp. K2]MCL3860833.1 LacI family DNA-binding transcriptional regulator [Actinotalea sp. K2]
MTLETARTAGRPVMTDVARLAGVSQKTVSRVINDAPNVSDDVRGRVLAAIASLGYRPNPAARALVTQRTRVLGIVTPGTALYGPTAQLFGIERAAWTAGYSVVIVSTAGSSGQELGRAIDRLVDHGVEGIVLAGSITVEDLAPDAFHGIPAISVGDPLSGILTCPAVAPDQRGGARLATEHLLALGHRTVWHVAGPDSWFSANSRLEGWREALVAAGAPVPEPISGDWTARAGYEAGLELAARPEVTAVFAANDQMAIGLMRALVEAGRRVPQDVSVVGFDDEPDSGYLLIPLTTVRQDFEVTTGRAVAELVRSITGEESSHGTTTIPVDLVIRSSSGPAPRTAPD